MDAEVGHACGADMGGDTVMRHQCPRSMKVAHVVNRSRRTRRTLLTATSQSISRETLGHLLSYEQTVDFAWHLSTDERGCQAGDLFSSTLGLTAGEGTVCFRRGGGSIYNWPK